MGDEADRIIEDGMLETLYEYGGLKSCLFCGEGGLVWGQDEQTNRWRLYKDGKQHVCAASRRWAREET